MSKTCISCDTISGAFQPPGGIVFENACWVVALRSNPVRFPCLPLLILKRHEEEVANLGQEEGSSLGLPMQQTTVAMSSVLQPAKIYFGIYAEEVRHMHVHVFPRMPYMPAGNLPNLWIDQWIKLLYALGLIKAYSNDLVAQYAGNLRQAYRKLV